MDLKFEPVSPLDYFASLVRSDQDFPLLEAAASIAQDEEPDLDVQQVLDDVERLIRRVRARVPPDADDLTRLAVLTQVFYKDMGFGQNANDYYAPENSYLQEVLRTRRGIPISLAVIWLELAQALGLHAQGISFPGHFLLKVALEAGLVVIDPVNGQSLGLDTLAISSTGDVANSSLTLGKYLTPRIFIQYGIGLFETESTLAVDYTVSERVKLEAKSGSTQSVDITYTVER